MSVKRIFGLVALLFAAMLPQAASAQTYWSVGWWYGGNSVPISSLQMNALTHIVHIGADVNADGTLTYHCASGPCTESQLGTEATALMNLAHPAGVKVILGLDNTTGTAWTGCTNGTNLSTCVTNIMELVNTYGYDGVDVDWEQSINFTQLGNLFTSLRTPLGTKILMAVANAQPAPVPANWAGVAGPLDALNISVQDQGGNFNPYTWFNNPLYGDANNSEWSDDLAISRYNSAGIALSKLIMCISFYGELQTGCTGPRQTCSISSNTQMQYQAIVGTYPSFVTSPTYDSVAKVPWFSPDGTHWVNYNDTTSVTTFVNDAKSRGVKGWFMFALEQDYFSGQTPSHPLMNAVAAAMGTGTAATPTFSPVAGTYTSPQSVTISDTSAGATIYYTTDGSTPTTASAVYSSPLTVNATTTVKAIASGGGFTDSSVGTATYTIKVGSVLVKAGASSIVIN